MGIVIKERCGRVSGHRCQWANTRIPIQTRIQIPQQVQIQIRIVIKEECGQTQLQIQKQIQIQIQRGIVIKEGCGRVSAHWCQWATTSQCILHSSSPANNLDFFLQWQISDL